MRKRKRKKTWPTECLPIRAICGSNFRIPVKTHTAPAA